MAEATVDRWLKKVGEGVKRFEPLLEVLTDKINTEIPSPVSGVLTEIAVPEGSTVRIGDTIAWVEVASAPNPASASTSQSQHPAGEDLPESGAVRGTPAASSTSAPAASSAPAEEGTTSGLTAEEQTAAASAPQVPPVPAPPTAGMSRSPLFSPAVRRLAAEYGIDPQLVRGTGEGGRVTREDIVAYAAAQRSANETAPAQPRSRATVAPSPEPAEVELVAPSALRRAIAQRMVESTRNIPHAWMMVEADVTGLVRLRQTARGEFTRREGFELTYFPFFVKAVVEGLRQYPTLNASWTDDGILYRRKINLGIAVAAEEGLVVPVLHAADGMSVAGIARAVRDLAVRARAGDLQPQEMRSGTFTVNNTGALGSVVSMPIISAQQSGIVTLETIGARPAVVGEGIAIRHLVNLSFSFDHRIADGLLAGRFMQAVRRVMEAYAPGDPVY